MVKNNIKSIIFPIFEVMSWYCQEYLHCCETDLWNFFIFQNWNSRPIKQSLLFPSPPQTPFTSCGYDVWLLWLLHVSVITQYLSFCDWSNSLSIMFSGFIHGVACDKMSFVFQGHALMCILPSHLIQQSYSWVYIQKNWKQGPKEIFVHPFP